MTKKLLIADDSVTIQRIVSLTFASEQIEVITASDGEDAIRIINETRPDIILVDTSLPVRNGYEICEHVKSKPGLSAIPTLLLVGTFEPLDEAEAKRVRADGHLTKPFESDLLTSRVKELLSRKPSPSGASFHAKSAVVNRPLSDSVALPKDLLELNLGRSLDENTRKSFVETPILEIYSDEALRILRGELLRTPRIKTEPAAKESAPGVTIDQTSKQKTAPPNAIDKALTDQLSEPLIDLIVKRVIEKLSDSVIREIAWEVVPELAEQILRDQIKKDKKGQK